VVNVPLVGRDGPLAELRALVDDAVDGRGSLVLLAGEAGVGKSRLAREALADPRTVFVEAAASEGGTPPYGPVVEALRAAFREEPDAAERLAHLRTHLATLLPELGDTAGGGDAATLVEALRTAFATLAAARPTLVLLDDLHWADAATIEVLPALAALAPGVPLLVVGTYRSDELPRGHALRRARTELRRAGRLTELAVEPLDERGTRVLASLVLGEEPGPALAAAIWDRSQGVPFFVEELANALRADGRVAAVGQGLELATGSGVALPDTIRDAVLARADGIEPAARAALEAASAVGSSVDLGLLEQLEADDGIEGALASGLLLDLGDGHAAFRHALTREALYQETPWIRRRALHARLSELLEAAGATPELVAGHALAAGQQNRAVPFLLQAAERFCAVHAYRDAARAGRQALELWSGDDDDPVRVAALARLGRCLQLSGELRQAVPVWREVADRSVRLGDLHGSAVARRELGTALDLLGRCADAYAVLADAAAVFAELGEPVDAARARIVAAGAVHPLHDHVTEATLLRQAQDDARRGGDEELRLTALALEGFALAKQRRLAEGLPLAQRALAEALAASLPEAAAEAYWAVAGILLRAGDEAAARSTLEQAIEHCAATGQEATRQFCVGCLALVLWKTGEWDRAVDLAREVYAVPDALGISRAHAANAWGCVESARGRARQARPLLAEAVRFSEAVGVPGGRESAAALGRLDEARGDLAGATDRCRRLLEALPGNLAATFVAPLRWAASHLASRGLAAETAACGEALARICADFPHAEARAALAATLGESSLLAGDGERAAAYFSDALGLYGEIEAPFERAETLVRAAAASVAAGERDTAVQQLIDAYRTARRLGARPLAGRAAAALDELGERVDERVGRRAQADLRPGGLTRRELEVLRRVALGRTNREIAHELVLSTRTVDMHVRNLLGKLGCRTRTEATMRALELGLVAPALQP
jgi:DNA-binding CsgD family transcriptional regulator